MASADDRPPFRLGHLDHVVLRARDAPLLIDFYCRVLGCTVEREARDLELTQLRAGASLIDIVSTRGPLGRLRGAAPVSDGGHNVDHVCLRVDPFDPATITRYLRDHGAAPSEVRHVYGAEGLGPSIYLDDPEGNTVELKGPADREPAR